MEPCAAVVLDILPWFTHGQTTGTYPVYHEFPWLSGSFLRPDLSSTTYKYILISWQPPPSGYTSSPQLRTFRAYSLVSYHDISELEELVHAVAEYPTNITHTIMSRSELMSTPAHSTNETHSSGLGSEFNNAKSPFLAAPAEIRQQILSHLFDVAMIDHKGDISCSTPDLQDVCQLLKEDMEVLHGLWMPLKYTVLRLNSPAEMRQVPAAILRLRNKFARNNQEWGYFEEVELDIFHPDALEEARKDTRYPGFLIELSSKSSLRAPPGSPFSGLRAPHSTLERMQIHCKRWIRALL